MVEKAADEVSGKTVDGETELLQDEEHSSEEPDPEPDNSAEEALRIAVEYYMRKAKKLQEPCAAPNEPQSTSANTGRDTDEDFINLIKPRRIKHDDSKEGRR